MTMHLEGPWLSTTGKKRGKIKFKSAEAKREHERLAQEWQDLLKRQGVEADAKKRSRAMKAEPLVHKLSTPAGRSTGHDIPSLNSGAGVAALAPAKMYTGTKVKGIATMHKSNAVPVFTDEEAIEISSMRR